MNMQPSVAGAQTEPAVVSEPTPPSAPPILGADQRALLRAVLNRIVPSQDALPGAGDLEVGASIERTLATSARLRRLFIDGLAEIAIAASRQAAAGFTELDAERQIVVLRTLEQRQRAFFVALVEHAYRGYYTLPPVRRALGVERPPQPLGYELPTFDPALLEQQRQRSPFWRRTT